MGGGDQGYNQYTAFAIGLKILYLYLYRGQRTPVCVRQLPWNQWSGTKEQLFQEALMRLLNLS